MLDFENGESVMGRERNHTVQRTPLKGNWRLIDMDTQGSHVRSREQPWTQVCGGEDCIEEAVERFLLYLGMKQSPGFKQGCGMTP